MVDYCVVEAEEGDQTFAGLARILLERVQGLS